MPTTLTYPGVYIEEIDSGVHPITGVATSIAAFVGRTARGLESEPVTVHSFGDFEQAFGGLSAGMSLGFAVRDFFLNGGSEAIIVRVTGGVPPAPPPAPGGGAAPAGGGGAAPAGGGGAPAAPAGGGAAPAGGGAAPADPAAPAAPADTDKPKPAGASTITLPAADGKSVILVAASSGGWGNALTAAVDTKNVAAKPAGLFNLTLKYQPTVGRPATETFLSVSADPASPRYLPTLLERQSNLARLSPDTKLPLATPTVTTGTPPVVAATGGEDGADLLDTDLIGDGFEADKKGLYALAKADLFNMLCIPPLVAGKSLSTEILTAAVTYCAKRRAMMIVDPPDTWTSKESARAGMMDFGPSFGPDGRNAAVFFPNLISPNLLNGGALEAFPPCGAVAGVFARTDAQRGVWKAPAGINATLVNVPQLAVPLHDEENGELNPLGLNCLRSFPVIGRVVWGARTMRGADLLADDYKYTPVRRLALFIEESLYRGTQWVVFEPNDEPLWASVRLNVGAFMHNLFVQGAFQGTTPRDAYFVKCDKESTTQNDIDLGIVNVVVGFAPLKPAEFVVIQIQQITGQIIT